MPTLRSRVMARETTFFPSIALLHTHSHPCVVLGGVRDGVGVPFFHVRSHVRPPNHQSRDDALPCTMELWTYSGGDSDT